MPSFSSLARMKRSIGLRAEATSLTHGQWSPDRRLEGPMRTAGAVVGPFAGRALGSLIDPVRKKPNLLLCQGRPFVRHQAGPFDALECMNQHALGRFARHEYCAGRTALANELRRIEPQPGLLHFGPMAFDAIPGHERLNVLGVVGGDGGVGQKKEAGQQEDGMAGKHGWNLANRWVTVLGVMLLWAGRECQEKMNLVLVV